MPKVVLHILVSMSHVIQQEISLMALRKHLYL